MNESFWSASEGPKHLNDPMVATTLRKGQLEKMFFCFPDPHFKRNRVATGTCSWVLLPILPSPQTSYSNHKTRQECPKKNYQLRLVVHLCLCDVPGWLVEASVMLLCCASYEVEHHLSLQCHDVRLYHATDVKELHEWMDQACEEHPQFERVLYSDFWADSICLTERGCISGYAMIYWYDYAVCLYADMWITSITSDKKWN